VSAHTARSPRYKPSDWRTPANVLTVSRIVVAPLVFWMMQRLRFDHPTFWLWFLLCWTDTFDGMLARRFGTTTSGAFLDPLADKVLALGAMAVLVVRHVFWWPWVALIAAREVAMSIYRSMVARNGVSIPARRSAKVKTAVQQSAVGFAIMPWVGIHASWVGRCFLFAAVALTWSTGVQYYLDANKLGAREIDVPKVSTS
jgi:CDP-diacylglycerol---glycerol-3-phosphate 3-phosphatidyltransferase